MNLIIVSELSQPPSEGLYFRFLTMMVKTELNMSVAVELEKQFIDRHYKFLKSKGYMDYVDDLIIPEWREEGVRIDTELRYPKTIKTPYIKCENTLNLLGQIKSLSVM